MVNLKENLFELDVLTGTNNWDLGKFLETATNKLGSWGSLFVILLGTICVIYAVYQIVTGLMSHGKKQTNWFIAITLLLVGGAISAPGGYKLITDIAGGGKKTIEDLGTGAVMLFEYSKFYFFK
ncbi:hypothetical protein [Paenibacillus amylolyticus]|uniref:hypothetical protein n=1 Tax=Paenibacillus amylolyticus TaxID=1451 RepID=UPI00201DD964|nr:hypothetical protein [Paenibacillus amylolyticus]MCL6663446.1 hypothetical protein [Paenibacillus amylolyticus]